MAEVADEVASGPQAGRRGSIIDHAWDEIGDWHS
jgi:hypothetical protein